MEEQQDEQYSHFDIIPKWPKFEILMDEISGRIPVAKLNSWQELPLILEEPFFNRHNVQLIFRGQRRYDWRLTPSLGRLDTTTEFLEVVSLEQMKLFRRAVRGRLSDYSLVDAQQETELWAIGQHYGLMTPLLDWTKSPFVALFFAFIKEDQKHENPNNFRVIYVLNRTFIEEDGICPDIEIFEPKRDYHGRLVNQDGLFTISNLDKGIENHLIDSILQNENAEIDIDNPSEFAQYICKIYIPNKDRDGCLKQLRNMNVHHASLFPDLQGASEFCNILVSEKSILQKERLTKEKQTEIKKLESVEVVIPLSTQEQITQISEALDSFNENKRHDPSTLQSISEELLEETSKHGYVDWERRESAQARLRNITRVLLRKYGYPANTWDEISSQIVDILLEKSEGST